MKITTKQLTAQEMVDKGVHSYVYVNMTFVSTLALILMLGIVTVQGHKSMASKKPNCSSFRGHYEDKDGERVYVTKFDEAQRALTSDPVKFSYLDADHDHVACETLKLRSEK